MASSEGEVTQRFDEDTSTFRSNDTSLGVVRVRPRGAVNAADLGDLRGDAVLPVGHSLLYPGEPRAWPLRFWSPCEEKLDDPSKLDNRSRVG